MSRASDLQTMDTNSPVRPAVHVNRSTLASICHRAVLGLQLWLTIILLLSAHAASATRECPRNPRMAGQHCLSRYLSITGDPDRIDYFTGLDVEYMRRICNSLRNFVSCLNKMDEFCPGVDKDDQDLPEGLISVWRMCTIPDRNTFIDLYARNQYCFQQVRAMSTRCYDDFSSRQYVTNTDTPRSLTEACRSLGSLESCVSNTVFNSCHNEESYKMVPRLVQASVPWSYKCLQIPEPTTSSTTQTENDIGQEYGNQETYWLESGAEQIHVNSLVLLMTITATLLSMCCNF